MINFTEKMTPEEIEDAMFGMACLRAPQTGTDYNIWIDYFGSTKKISPRVLIDFDGHCTDVIPISIDEFNPKVLVDREVPNFEKVANWIKRNYSVLIQHWHQEFDDGDAIFLLLHGITLNECRRQHYLLYLRYWNGDISYDEVSKVLDEEQKQFLRKQMEEIKKR